MKNFLLAIFSACLLSAGWLGLSGLPLLAAFIPLLVISAGYAKGRAGFWKTFGYVALAFGLWSAATTWWIAFAGSGAWSGAVLSVLITVTLFGGIFMLFHYVSKRAPRPLAYILLVTGWIACEYLYLTGEVSFPWLVLGNGFSGDTIFVQWYDTTGVFGGSLWVWMCNILIYHAVVSRRAYAWIAPAAALILPMGASLVRYHTYEEPHGTIKVTAVQPNFDPHIEKFRLDEDYQISVMLSLAMEAPEDVDYIIFPETAVNTGIIEGQLERSETLERYRDLLRTKYPHARIILGATTQRFYNTGERAPVTARRIDGIYRDHYNSAIVIDTTLQAEVHHKSMLVVGVEKMPYAGRIKWLDELILDLGGTTGNYGVDTVRTVFVHGATAVGTAICWEGVYGWYCSEFVQGGAQAMFIISNDGWWRDTQGYRRLFSFARLRAIETRRAVARSANTGISGFIDQRGDVLAQTQWDERVAITGRIALNDKITFYTRYGDYTARISVYAFLLSVLSYVAYRIYRRNRMTDDL